MDKFAKARFLFTKTRALSLRPPILPIKLFTLNAYTYIASRMIRRYSTKQTGLPPFGRLVASFPSRGDSRTSTSITGIQEQSTSMTVSIISHDSPNKTSLSTTDRDIPLLSEPYGPPQNSISSSLFVVPPEERAIALVAAVAVLSEPELILVNTEELVKTGNNSFAALPQRVCGRAGLVRCEECRWEGRKDIETIAPFVRADYQKKGISPNPIRTQHLRQFISSLPSVMIFLIGFLQESRRPRHGYDSPPIIRLENKHINHELNAFVDALIFDVESLGCTNAKPGHPVSLTLSSPSRCAIVETSSGIADCGPPHMQRRGETSVTFVRYEMCSSSDVIPAFAKNTGSEGSVAVKPRPYDNLVVLVHVHCSPLQNWHCTENIHPVSTLFSFHIYCIVFVCERVVV
ncbi:hypothetical protein BLNAU_22040 [Blattamonas nauphoetae]|uniref:Uncharacterized protein n=1 Tax=Blattamonas nauphoetae TaxID=2049346 RepID=A0ABQ9WV62_9EUKA|nr:hypothetical protein BLNAU_22040 [Blattamonas nauphoetae]